MLYMNQWQRWPVVLISQYGRRYSTGESIKTTQKAESPLTRPLPRDQSYVEAKVLSCGTAAEPSSQYRSKRCIYAPMRKEPTN
ncbi:hypothetical protein M378DRAFT_167082, partial [Amanita muscaria Koide BX008]